MPALTSRTTSKASPAAVTRLEQKLREELNLMDQPTLAAATEIAPERSQDEGDIAQALEHEFTTDLLKDREWIEKTEISAALDRIKNGTYGICENCDDAIPNKRLQALPHAKYCVDCQSDMEGLKAG